MSKRKYWCVNLKHWFCTLGILVLVSTTFTPTPLIGYGCADANSKTLAEISRGSVSASKIYIVDNSTESIAMVLSIMKEGRVSYPVLIYQNGSEKYILRFIAQLKVKPQEIICGLSRSMYYNVSYNVFVNNIKGLYPNTVTILPLWFFGYLGYWYTNKNNTEPHQLIVVEDHNDLTPYGILYASLTHSPIVTQWAKAKFFIIFLPTIKEIRYFGYNSSAFERLVEYYLSYRGHALSNRSYICSIDGAEREIVSLYQEMKITGVIPSNYRELAKNEGLVFDPQSNHILTILPSVSIDPFNHWKAGVIYASQRETMLLTVRERTYQLIDGEIDRSLNNNIKPYNNNSDPIWMVIFASQEVIPTRARGNSADQTRYADRNGDNKPDIAIGRITHGMNDLSIINLFSSRGVFFEYLKQSNGAVFQVAYSRPQFYWFPQLGTVRENLYSMGYNVSEYYIPTTSQKESFLRDITNSEIILTSGHGWSTGVSVFLYPVPYPSIDIHASELSELNFTPSFWSLESCGVSSITNGKNTFMAILPRQGLVNIWCAVDLTGYDGRLEMTDRLLKGFSVGIAGMKAFSGYVAPQYTLYGDPLVVYSGERIYTNDTVAPLISHRNISTAPLSYGFEISANVQDESEVKHVEVWYRQPGATPSYYWGSAPYAARDDEGNYYFVIPMTKRGDCYSVTMPPLISLNFDTSKPLYYKIVAYDKDNANETPLYSVTLN